jgi:hypothetical protein
MTHGTQARRRPRTQRTLARTHARTHARTRSVARAAELPRNPGVLVEVVVRHARCKGGRRDAHVQARHERAVRGGHLRRRHVGRSAVPETLLRAIEESCGVRKHGGVGAVDVADDLRPLSAQERIRVIRQGEDVEVEEQLRGAVVIGHLHQGRESLRAIRAQQVEEALEQDRRTGRAELEAVVRVGERHGLRRREQRAGGGEQGCEARAAHDRTMGGRHDWCRQGAA